MDVSHVYDWLYGYWTALNARNSTEQELVQRDLFHFSAAPNAILEQLERICSADPDDLVVNAGMSIYERLPVYNE